MSDTGSLSRAWRAALLALAVAGWAGTAAALSFTIPEGASIVDVELNDTPTSTAYNGTSETFSIVAGLDIIRLDGAPDIILDPGAVEMSIQVSLDGVITNTGTSLSATYGNPAYDFTIIDVAGGNVPIFAGNFVDGAALQMPLVNGMLIVTGSLSGEYDSADLDNDFDDAIAPTGYLSVNFSQINPATTYTILDNPNPPSSPGFKNFTAYQVADMTPFPVPEPATGWLVALGITALAARSRWWG